MVFKVKQKGQTEYSDQVTTQAGSSDSQGIFDQAIGSINRRSRSSSEESDDYNLMFNWPYDYLSFVEMVKFEAEVLYSGTTAEERTTIELNKTIASIGAATAADLGEETAGPTRTATPRRGTRTATNTTTTTTPRRGTSTATDATTTTPSRGGIGGGGGRGGGRGGGSY